jgi:hypothetical protein
MDLVDRAKRGSVALALASVGASLFMVLQPPVSAFSCLVQACKEDSDCGSLCECKIPKPGSGSCYSK